MPPAPHDRPAGLPRRHGRTSSVALLLALAACGGDAPTGGTRGTGGQTVARLQLDAVPDSLVEAEERQYAASATTADGRPVGAPTLAWSSSDTTVLVVSTAGTARGVRAGTATVRVASGAVTAEAAVRVLPARIADVRIRGGDSVVVGTTALLAAEPRDPTGRALAPRPTTWTAQDTTVARVDANGLVQGVALGRTSVTATVDGVSGTRPVVVRAPYAAALSFARVPDSLWTGVRDSVRAILAEPDGRPVTDGRPITYSTDAPAVLEVQPDGRIRPIAAGTATIRADGDRLTATRAVTVRVAPVSQVVVVPDTLVILGGSGSQLYPILLDLGGDRQFRRAVRYRVEDPAVATVDASGAVRAVAVGTTTVHVTSERGTGSAVVRVIDPPADRFRIELRFVNPPGGFEQAFRSGVDDWERAIIRGGGGLTISFPANVCGSADPPRIALVRHLLIYVRLEDIDGRGGILGQAGPCLVRSADGLPIVGQMRFDTNDLSNLARAGTLQAVVSHEIGHVVGVIRSVWNSGSRVLVPGFGTVPDPRFVGRRGSLASAGLGFTGIGEGAQIETEGGPGTAGTHWRESTYSIELMTGIIETPGVPGTSLDRRPMSLLTIESLADVGYLVAHSASDVFGRLLESPLGGPPLARRLPVLLGTGAPAVRPPHSEPVAPWGTVGADGRVRPLRDDR